jgi:hypothetical protein
MPTEKASGDIAASPKALETRQEWLKRRISTLDRAAQAKLILAWPQGVPRLQDCNNAQLDALIKTIEAVEADASAPFFEPDPTQPKPKRRKLAAFDPVEETR